MAVRLLLTDAAGAEMEPRFAALQHKAGSPPELRDRLCIAAVLSLARTGMPWREMPREFGHGEAVYKRFRRREARGLWRQRGEGRQQEGGHVAPPRFTAGTMRRAPQHAAGARKNMADTRPRRWAALGVGVPPHATPAALTKRPGWPSS
jgi:transposase